MKKLGMKPSTFVKRSRKTANDLLKGVYTAKQCCDLNDIEIALSHLRHIAREINMGIYTPAMRKRLTALENKRNEISGRK